MMTSTTTFPRPMNGNGGIVPPWLEAPSAPARPERLARLHDDLVDAARGAERLQQRFRLARREGSLAPAIVAELATARRSYERAAVMLAEHAHGVDG